MKRVMFAVVILVFLIPVGEVLTQTPDPTQPGGDPPVPSDVSKPEGMPRLEPGPVIFDQMNWIRTSQQQIEDFALIGLSLDPSEENFEEIRKVINRTWRDLQRIAKVPIEGPGVGPGCSPPNCPMGQLCVPCEPPDWRMWDKRMPDDTASRK